MVRRLKLIDGQQLWNSPASQACEEMIRQRRPHVILTSGPPHTVHLIGRALKRRHELPWIADFRDPWCSWGNEKRYTGKPPAFNKSWERSVFAEANVIVANTSNTAKMFSEVYPESASRIVAIPNGYEPAEVAKEQPRVPDSLRLTLLHTGVVYAGRDPRPLAEAVRSIGKTRSLEEQQPLLRLIGKCLDPNVTKALESSDFSPWVRMEEHIPYDESQFATRNADILVLLDTKDRRLGVPAKLYEYLGANRPILALAEQDGDTAQVLRQSRVPHRVVSEWSPVALEQAILSLCRQSSAPKVGSSNGGITADFTRAAAAQKLAQVMNQLIDR